MKARHRLVGLVLLLLGCCSWVLTLEVNAETSTSADSKPMARALPFRVTMQHSNMDVAQGQPAVMLIGDAYPVISIDAFLGRGVLQAFLVCGEETLIQLEDRRVAEGDRVELIFPGRPLRNGTYEVRLLLAREGSPAIHHALRFSVAATAQEKKAALQAAYLGEQGRLQYAPDYLGNRIPDFSFAGFGGGGVAIPEVAVQAVVEPGDGDDTARIQAAVDEVSALPLDASGFRGTVLLKRGTYQVGDAISITTSGVVLRGEGSGEDGTILTATGKKVRDLIEIRGKEAVSMDTDNGRQITDLYVPVGAHWLHLDRTDGLQVGDTVVVRRYGNVAWIHAIGMDQLPPVKDGNIQQWKPFALDMERIITRIDGDRIFVDAPIVNAIEWEWGGGEVFKVKDQRIEHVGVEHLRAVSEYNSKIRCSIVIPCDEQHASYLVSFHNVKNAWARDLTARYFYQGMAYANSGSKWVTIQDTRNLDPISTIQGSRRYTYHVLGQLILVQRAYSDKARHAFVFNKHVAGPNVFLHSRSEGDYAFSEPHQHWAVGGLYDNVTAPIAVQDRYTYGSGHGWSGANFVAWNTTGKQMIQKPPTAQNWAIGHVGAKLPGDFLPRTDGYWVSEGQHVQPQSLYLQQLQDRLGRDALANIGY